MHARARGVEILKMQALRSYEVLVNVYQSARRYIPQDFNVQVTNISWAFWLFINLPSCLVRPLFLG